MISYARNHRQTRLLDMAAAHKTKQRKRAGEGQDEDELDRKMCCQGHEVSPKDGNREVALFLFF